MAAAAAPVVVAAAAAAGGSVGSTLSIDEKIHLITRNLQEVMGANDGKETIAAMREILKTRDLSVYWGTATTGAPHIGYFVPMSKIADFLRAGCRVTILFADLHAYLDNMKSSWQLLQFRTKYYEAVIKAMLTSIGVPIEKLKFVRGTEYQLSEKYTLDVYKMSSLCTERNAKKAGAEVVKQVASPLLSGLLYPLLQALDEEYLGVDMQFGGVDQRKIFTFAEETLPKVDPKYKKRIHLMNPMVPGLQGPKMSSSEKGSKIDLLESEESVIAKLGKAYAKPKEVEDNGVLAFCKMVLFALNPNGLTIEREQKFGGNIHFADYKAMEDAYVAGSLFPLDLKSGVAKLINQLLAPIRKHFQAPDMVKLIADAYPADSEQFHQTAAEPAADEKGAASDDEKPAAPAAAAGAGAGAAAAGAGAKKGAPAKAAGGKGAKKAEGVALLDIRVGQIVKANAHPKGDHLIQLELNVGEAKVRHVVCGGGKAIAHASLVGKSVPVVLNIKKTEGLVFVAQSADGKSVAAVEAPAGAAVGARVLPVGAAAAAEYGSERDDLRKELWATVTINGAGEVVFGASPALGVGAATCKAPGVAGGKLA